MKQVVNSSLTKLNYDQVATAHAAWALKIPNYVWLAMILVAAAALSLTTVAREREEVRSARAAYAQTQERARQAQAQTERLRIEIKNLKENPRAAERVAQEQLNYVRPNEIIIATR